MRRRWSDRMGGTLGFIRACIGGLALGLLMLAGFAFWSASKNAAASPATVTIAGLSPVARSLPLGGLSCLGPAQFASAAAQNRATLDTAAWAPFGVSENGWAVYAPLIAREIGTDCEPASAGFAAAFSRWRTAHGLSGAGQVDAHALSLLATIWLLRRPFVRAMKGGCPPSPDEQSLATAAPEESFGGKLIKARPAALDAYRRMTASARQDISPPPPILAIASAYRGPVEEAARCADGSCGNPAKARCSAHRTGLAMDLFSRLGPRARTLLHRQPGSAVSKPHAGLSVAGAKRGSVRLHALSLRALALGVDGGESLIDARLGPGDGGHGWDRTSDPLDVNEVLSR